MLMASSNSASISVRRGLDFCTMRAAKFFALQSEQVRALGLALLYLGSLHHVGITVAVVVEPEVNSCAQILFCYLLSPLWDFFYILLEQLTIDKAEEQLCFLPVNGVVVDVGAVCQATDTPTIQY